VLVAAAFAVSCLLAPVDAPVIDAFRPPACPWCPGNRGLEFGVEPGQQVRAVVPGRVTFAGDVARDRFVTVRLDDGRLMTYGRLERITVGVGDLVVSGQLVGRSADTFILTVRRDGDYEDPAPLLAGHRRARLVPLDGSSRPAAAPGCGRGPRWGSAPGIR
jgi:murein DD-endopeptidase MepM/ murein hydrolase activator NlpD